MAATRIDHPHLAALLDSDVFRVLSTVVVLMTFAALLALLMLPRVLLEVR